ncbi:MAG: NAD(P)H-dependent oxidoreductase subunit E [Microthrixaceae bacterium]
MARLTPDNERLAREIVSHYPRPKSATIPLCHLAQEQDGYLTDDAIRHIAELVGVTPAEVLGTASFYEMFKRDEVGRYVVNVCTNISCQLVGGEELLAHAAQTLGVPPGSTTPDGMFTLEDVECIAACTEAPACQINYRYFHRVTNEAFDEVVAEIRSGRRDDIPDHGTLGLVRQHIPEDRRAGIHPVEGQTEPAYLAAAREAAERAAGADPTDGKGAPS